MRYVDRMTQLVARIHDDLARSTDRLIAEGVVESRFDAARSVCKTCGRRLSVSIVGLPRLDAESLDRGPGLFNEPSSLRTKA
jgi:hypothetical protein